MPDRIRILHLEDEPRDSELVERLLVSEGLKIALLRVDDEAGFRDALRSDGLDLILSDYSLPGFDGPRALELARELRPDLPFIFLSGKMGEDLAVESLKQGAMDYVLKRLLSRLPSSVERAIKEKRFLRAQAEADRELREQRDELQRVNAKLLENQAQLIQSEKLASLGQLSAGIAHEINNPMAFVTMNLETLEEYVGVFKRMLKGYRALAEALGGTTESGLRAALDALAEEARNANLEHIQQDVDTLLAETRDGIGRVNAIVKALRNMAHTDMPETEPTDVHECLADAIKLAGNELRNKCVVRKEFGSLPLIQAHPGQLRQVFLNLVVNAAQSMDHGEVSIRTRADGLLIVIEIEDQGSGISEENLPKLFTPFFTTKPRGQGTGLGLSISYGIIRNHGGDIKVASRPGIGTVFTVSLPGFEPTAR